MDSSPAADRVLLVDDMPSIHEDFQRILAPRRGPQSMRAAEDALFGPTGPPAAQFVLDCAFSGEEGLKFLKAAKLENRPYALAFVDMRMPTGWDGVSTVEELWREDRELQVVICTAYSDHPLEQTMARLGSPDRLLVLKKPFDPIEVSQLARALTAKRRLTLQAAAHLANLEQVLREVEGAAAELRRRNRELELLTRAFSQDLRSPMAAINKFIGLLSQELGSHRGDKLADYVERLRIDARSGEELVDGVLALTGIACSELTAEPLDISEIARQAMAARRKANPRRKVSTSVQDGLRAWGDRRLVHKALDHLIDNALKFTSRQEVAAITFGANPGPDGAPVFFVRDSGCGFDAAGAGDLFRKFQRLHSAGEFSGGGVGLLAVGRIVERHGGRVWADSRPGHGATVFFTLPGPAPGFAS